MLLLIRAQWCGQRSAAASDATVHFRILRDGSVEAIELVSSSGYNSFDLAALGPAGGDAAPTPAPRLSRRELGVNLIFR